MIFVSAAIIRNTAGEIMICQRGAGGSCAFLWEFPGGKQEAGETAADCLVRECWEELGIEIDIVALLEQTSYTYPDNKIGLSFFAAKITGGVPQKKRTSENFMGAAGRTAAVSVLSCRYRNSQQAGTRGMIKRYHEWYLYFCCNEE